MFPFRYQLLGHFATALLLTLLLSFALSPGQTELGQKNMPFTNQAAMLAVTAVVYPDGPPKIAGVTYLQDGRLSVARPGPYRLSLQNEAGQELYALSFRVSYTIPGIDEELDEARQVFVLPASEDATELILSGPQGEARHSLERR